jgi:uncharacterized membrane protein (UPF0127 family)
MFVQLSIRGFPVRVWQCDTQAEMEKGLIGVSRLDDDEGLMLPSGTGGLHTVGMMIPIDVIWLDSAGNALAVDQNVMPNLRVPQKGVFAIELAGGWLARHGGTRQVTGGCGGAKQPTTGQAGGCGCGCNGGNGAIERGLVQAGYLLGQGAMQGKLAALPDMLAAITQAGGMPVHNVPAPNGQQYVGARGGHMSPMHRASPAAMHGATAIERSLYGMHTPHGMMTQLVGAGGHGGAFHGGALYGGAPHGGGFGGGHPHHGGHHGGHHPHHGHGFGPWGWGGAWYPGWAWWDWGYDCDPCDPCDPYCPDYDPTLNCT